MEEIAHLINDLSRNPFDPHLNFAVAQKYLELNQTASAVSFFLRCAEYGEDKPECELYVYNSLLAIAKCFDTQKGREYSVANTLLQAITFCEYRPEAYFFLSNYYERASQWQESYTFATLGKNMVNERLEPLPLPLDYVAPYCLDFQMAIAGWWIGRKNEALEIFNNLSKQTLHPVYENSVKYNLEKLNALL